MLIILIIILNYQMEKYVMNFFDSPLKNGVMNVELLIRENSFTSATKHKIKNQIYEKFNLS